MTFTATMPAPSSNAKILDRIMPAAQCCDTADVLNTAATLWERVGGSLYQLLTYKAATKRMESLARRYAVLKAKQSEADAAHTAKYYEVAQFERVFEQLLNA